VEVTELALRDGHQSLLATRMAMEDMAPICGAIDQAGYWSVECWGGATYDACIRFLNEDPWERLRRFRKLLPNSRLQMLLRGQNLLGYRHYEDGVAASWPAASPEPAVPAAVSSGWSRSRARRTSAPPARPGAWRTEPTTSSGTCCRRCRCGSGSSRCRGGSASSPLATRPSRRACSTTRPLGLAR